MLNKIQEQIELGETAKRTHGDKQMERNVPVYNLIRSGILSFLQKLKKLEKSQNNAGNTQFDILLGLNYNSLRVSPKGFIRTLTHNTITLSLLAKHVDYCNLSPIKYQTEYFLHCFDSSPISSIYQLTKSLVSFGSLCEKYRRGPEHN